MTFTPDRRSVVRAAAWTTPVVAIGAAAPAMAQSGPPNLSTSTSGGLPRTGTTTDGDAWLRFNPSTFTNTGGTAVEGLAIVFASNVPITNIELMFFETILDAGALGITFTGLGTTTVTMTVPVTVANIAPGASWTSPAEQRLTFDATATDTINLNVDVTASNGGVGWTSPSVSCTGDACAAS